MRDLAERAGGVVVTDARELVLLKELDEHLMDRPVDVVGKALGGNVLCGQRGHESVGATTVAGDEVLEELFDGGFEMHSSVFLTSGAPRWCRRESGIGRSRFDPPRQGNFLRYGTLILCYRSIQGTCHVRRTAYHRPNGRNRTHLDPGSAA